MNATTTEALILAGEGYQLTISPEARQKKAELLAKAASVTTVTDNDESNHAQFEMRKLAEMRILIEKSRKAVKEPVLLVGKAIDKAAADFLADIEGEELRIRGLVGAHAEEVERLKAIKAEEERRAFEDARAARLAKEQAEQAAAETRTIADVLAAKQAAEANKAALDARLQASEELATTQQAAGVRFAWDFEVTDIDLLAQRQRACVEITPRRREIKTMLDLWAERLTDDKLVDTFDDLGIRLFKKPIISTR
jgi:CRISPR/Cas system-associated exonuclease Cas4 (RecB family)